MPRYLDPKSDFVFKKIFGQHPNLLKDFLNAILPLPSDCVIESLDYLTTESVPELVGFKNSIVDVRCLDNHGRRFIVEMQLQWTSDFIKRMLFNTAATYARQLKKGEPYDQLSPVYGVALLDAIAFNDDAEWFHHYRMISAHDHKKSLEDIQLVLIELPKFKPTSITQKRLAILWIRFLKEINEKTKIVDPSLLEVASIKEALSLLEISAYTEAELLAYDQSWDAVSSERTLLHGKYKDGKAEGLATGFAKGLAKGEAKGRVEGKVEMIHNLHQLGISLEQIATAAQLSCVAVSKVKCNTLL
ncbi:MAG: Rpn family recombination-promoting nuclease/putative transposase [Verrucomicrobiae bacterium]|nr:Rpn family recombination-promoting nuclease/putative transposase [Verrucomicrobiae bacterium]